MQQCYLIQVVSVLIRKRNYQMMREVLSHWEYHRINELRHIFLWVLKQPHNFIDLLLNWAELWVFALLIRDENMSLVPCLLHCWVAIWASCEITKVIIMPISHILVLWKLSKMWNLQLAHWKMVFIMLSARNVVKILRLP